MHIFWKKIFVKFPIFRAPFENVHFLTKKWHFFWQKSRFLKKRVFQNHLVSRPNSFFWKKTRFWKKNTFFNKKNVKKTDFRVDFGVFPKSDRNFIQKVKKKIVVTHLAAGYLKNPFFAKSRKNDIFACAKKRVSCAAGSASKNEKKCMKKNGFFLTPKNGVSRGFFKNPRKWAFSDPRKTTIFDPIFACIFGEFVNLRYVCRLN